MPYLRGIVRHRRAQRGRSRRSRYAATPTTRCRVATRVRRDASLPALHHHPHRLDEPEVRGVTRSWGDTSMICARARRHDHCAGSRCSRRYLGTGLAYDTAGFVAATAWLASIGSSRLYTPATVDERASVARRGADRGASAGQSHLRLRTGAVRGDRRIEPGGLSRLRHRAPRPDQEPPPRARARRCGVGARPGAHRDRCSRRSLPRGAAGQRRSSARMARARTARRATVGGRGRAHNLDRSRTRSPVRSHPSRSNEPRALPASTRATSLPCGTRCWSLTARWRPGAARASR